MMTKSQDETQGGAQYPRLEMLVDYDIQAFVLYEHVLVLLVVMVISRPVGISSY
jgi:hypothetical protein